MGVPARAVGSGRDEPARGRAKAGRAAAVAVGHAPADRDRRRRAVPLQRAAAGEPRAGAAVAGATAACRNGGPPSRRCARARCSSTTWSRARTAIAAPSGTRSATPGPWAGIRSVAIVAPGGAFSCTDSHEPGGALDRDQRDGRSACHGARRLVQRRTVAAGTTTSAADQQRAERRQRGDRRPARPVPAAPRRTAAPRTPERTPPRRGRSRVASQARPSVRDAASARRAGDARRARRSRGSTSSRLPNSSVSTPAPDSNTSLARITPSASMPARPSAVVTSGPRRSRPPSAATRRANARRGRQRAQRGGEAEAVREHQARERRRCRPRGSRRRGRAGRSSSRARRRRPRAAAPPPARAGRRAARTGPAGRPSRRGIPDNANGSHYHRAVATVYDRRRGHAVTQAHANGPSTRTAELRRAGHRSGGARAAVIDLMARQHCCLTAQEVFDRLRADGRVVGIASVYRALDLLSRLGLVRRLDIGAASGYEPAHPGRRAPPPRRVRPLRQGLLVRGRGARGRDRAALAAPEAHGRRARRGAARRRAPTAVPTLARG